MVNNMKDTIVTKALETNSFASNAASAAYINPILWVKTIEDFAKAKVVMEPLGKKIMNLFGVAGTQANEQFDAEITASALTESTAIVPSALSYTQVTYTPSEVGLAVAITQKEKVRSINDIMADKAMAMGYALAKKLDQDIFTALDAASVGTAVTPGGVAISAIASSDTLTTDAIADAIAGIRGKDYEAKYLVIHPAQEKALMKLSQFVDASVYGGREVVMNGEIGRYLGLRVLVTTLVPANATTATAKNAYVLDQDAFGIAWKQQTSFRDDYKVLEREHILAATRDYAVKVRLVNKIARIVAYA